MPAYTPLLDSQSFFSFLLSPFLFLAPSLTTDFAWPFFVFPCPRAIHLSFLYVLVSSEASLVNEAPCSNLQGILW